MKSRRTWPALLGTALLIALSLLLILGGIGALVSPLHRAGGVVGWLVDYKVAVYPFEPTALVLGLFSFLFGFLLIVIAMPLFITAGLGAGVLIASRRRGAGTKSGKEKPG